MDRRRVVRVLRNGLWLRCPRCGATRLFDGLFHMRDVCANCHLRFEREPGYFVGAIYVNYGLTVVAMVIGFLLLEHFAGLTASSQLPIWIGFAIVFPLLGYRYSKSLWLSVEFLINPEEPAPLRRVR